MADVYSAAVVEDADPSYQEWLKKLPIDSAAFDDVMLSRFFWTPSFEIYGGSSGLYDLGPQATAIQNNLLNVWRKHFVLEEGMHELETTILTPEQVLISSEHVKKFKDFMVRDIVTEECYRADHLLEQRLDQLMTNPNNADQKSEMQLVYNNADALSCEELQLALRKYETKAPVTGNDISDVFDFNLMFSTVLGPHGDHRAYLRPETAQGIFMNFSRLFKESGEVLPFAAATIGRAFRNEISPHSKLLRVREFTMAEIEHFCDPGNKNHPRFAEVANLVLPLWPRESQDPPEDQQIKNHATYLSIGQAVKLGLIENETMGYFLGRIYQFLNICGVKQMRFRQHLIDEKAHYSNDCWDAELLSSHGWVECIGLADRSCFDLARHAEASSKNLRFFKKRVEPVLIHKLVAVPVKRKIGVTFREDSKQIIEYIEELEEDAVKILQSQLETGSTTIMVNDTEFIIEPDMIDFKVKSSKNSGEWLLPSVVEPSFGIGRLIYCILEQSFYSRSKQVMRKVLKLPPIFAPVKCSVLSLMKQEKFMPTIQRVASILRNNGISSRVDCSSATIGRRYARTDEIGIPFGITVDHITLDDDTVTLRERDTTEQIRFPIKYLPVIINDMVEMKCTWKDVRAKFPIQN